MTTPSPIGTIVARKGTTVPDWPLFAIDWRGAPIVYSGGTFAVTIRQAAGDVVVAGITIAAQATPSGDGSNPAVDVPTMYATRTLTALDPFQGKVKLIVKHSTNREHIYDLDIVD